MDDTVPSSIYEILKEAIPGDIENFECAFDVHKTGEGFTGGTYFIYSQDKTSGDRLHFVVKQAVSDVNAREIHPVAEVFLNEIHFYTEVCPKFLKLQEKIPQNLRFFHLAKCLAASTEKYRERLVLDNISYQGFAMHEKTKPFEKATFEHVFKVYGKLHATSFAYKALHPEEFSDLASGVIDVWSLYLSKKLFHDAMKFTHQQALECLQPGADDAIIEKYKHYVEGGIELAKKSLIIGPYTSILHGDCWSNNIMFKFDESGKVIDLRLIDFQNARLGSPVCDLSYCLYSGGTKETFDELDHLLRVYHRSLSENIKAFRCDPNELYPWEALKKDWKVHAQLGLPFGLMLWRMKLTYDDDRVDINDISEDDGDASKIFEAKFDKETYTKRARDILLHFYENDFFYST